MFTFSISSMPILGKHVALALINLFFSSAHFFRKRSLLLRHRVVHSEAKYVCEFCQRAFVRDDKRKRHIRCVHSHERPFVCEVCAKAFARKWVRLKIFALLFLVYGRCALNCCISQKWCHFESWKHSYSHKHLCKQTVVVWYNLSTFWIDKSDISTQ